VLAWIVEKNTKKIGLFNLSMVVIGSMIGAGVLVVPNDMMSFGFAGTLGWCLASVCSFVLASIFVKISLESENGVGLSQVVMKEYGAKAGFMSGFSHSMFLIISCAAILAAFINYLFDCCNLSGELTKFIISALVVSGMNLMHVFTSFGFKLLSGITILKILLFGSCAILGIVAFDAVKLLCLDSPVNALNTPFVSQFISTIKASSVALFAFAGLENAAASSDLVKNPNSTIPRATMLGVVLCSIIYLLTHISVVNALGSTIKSATPVKTALSILIGNRFGTAIGGAAGAVVSAIAVLGCMGTLLALIYVAPNVLYNNVKIAHHQYNSRRSRTGLPIRMSILCSLAIIALAFCRYVLNLDMTSIYSTCNFLLVYFYFQCVLVYYKTSHGSILSILGFAACLILLAGCNQTSVFIGTMVQLAGQILYASLERKSQSKLTVD
jgi:basic amino acid/polyamine antiporter, APA family